MKINSNITVREVKNDDELKEFVKNNVYVSKDVLDYDTIECEWINADV